MLPGRCTLTASTVSDASRGLPPTNPSRMRPVQRGRRIVRKRRPLARRGDRQGQQGRAACDRAPPTALPVHDRWSTSLFKGQIRCFVLGFGGLAWGLFLLQIKTARPNPKHTITGSKKKISNMQEGG